MSTTETPTATGYAGLMRVPGFAYLYSSLLIGRVSGQMVAIALILFVLARYHSPQLAGLTAFLAVTPGLVVSPIAGALLDRYGRSRLVMLDNLIAAGDRIADRGPVVAPRASSAPASGDRVRVVVDVPAEQQRSAGAVSDPRPATPLGARERARQQRSCHRHVARRTAGRGARRFRGPGVGDRH